MCDVYAFIKLGAYANYISVPPIVILLLLGFLILFSDSRKTTNRIFFLMSFFIAVWITSDFLSYKFSNPDYILWADRISASGLIAAAFFVLFLYIFPEKESIPKRIWLYIFVPLLPLFALVPTDIYETIGPAPECNSIVGSAFWIMIAILLYDVFLGIVFSLEKRKSLNNVQKDQFRMFVIGFLAIIFLGIVVDVLPSIFSNESIVLFTPYATLIFIGFCTYAIVKYKSLNAKLITAQAVTILIWILIGSEFLYLKNIGSIVLTAITLLLSVIFGIMLIRSVKTEVERKEQLQKMTDSLAQANDQLRVLDNAKTEFISIASHQLRSPVTATKGYMSLLIGGSYGKISRGVKGVLEKVFVSSERQANLIEDLLNVSRIESGRLTFNFEKASITDVLKELYENFLLIANSKKLYLDLQLPKEPLPEFKMDAEKIRELISNIIDNALKYTEKGGVTISLEARENGEIIDEKGFVKDGEKSPYGKVVRITVSDTGIGIPKEEIPFLFRKFSRGKDTSRLHASGTGLGLFVGKAIADAHHGAIWLESEGAGKGSKFIIEIPINNG